jgi:hypothetical protein
MSRNFEAYMLQNGQKISTEKMLVRILSLRKRAFKELAECLLDSTQDKSLSEVEIPK